MDLSESAVLIAGMNKPRLFLTRRFPAPVEAALNGRYAVTSNPGDLPIPRDTLAAAIAAYDGVCLSITDRVDEDMLLAPGRRARILANYGVGFDHIDIAAATRAGMLVTNTPDALTDATAEIAILLMMMAARRAGEGERQLRAGRWQGFAPTYLVGQQLFGKTLGLVGFGRIAQATAPRAAAFGMNVLYNARRRSPNEDGARFVADLGALIEQADIVSLHVPGGAETRHLVDARLLARMKASAILVNTARGSVVDEAALADALQSRRIAAAGLDVFEQEPHVPAALLACDNAVLLPHLGSATIETRTAMGMQMVANLDAFFADQEPPNRIA